MLNEDIIPDFLSHYYERARGPFRNLSHILPDEAEQILHSIRQEGKIFASQRAPEYLRIRRELEDRVRQLFAEKGGLPRLERPHYMILGACPWVKDWYTDGCELRIPLSAFDPDIVSFTYGDTFPAMRLQEGKPYRGQVYRLDELPEVIRTYGLPQDWNADGQKGPERYIEAQVWADEPIRKFLQQVEMSASGIIGRMTSRE